MPESHLEAVKEALFSIGAGKMGQYDHCSWQTKGIGQFRPLEGSKAFVGELNKITQVDEYKVEMVCEDWLISQIIAELRATHPYEEPAFDAWKLEDY